MSRIVKRSALDEDFRRNVLELVNSARKEILVITGEFESYRFIDLRLGVERARDRGVKVKVYAKRPSPGVLNKLLMHGCEVYVGRELPKDHYLVMDQKSWMLSEEHPPRRIGVRRGIVHEGDPDGAKKVVKLFRELVAKAERMKEPDWERDPLWQALQSPLDWGVETDSSRLDEEFVA